MKKMKFIGFGALILLWAALSCTAWLCPAEETSESERRQLAQFPEFSITTVLDGKFMTDFEDYSLDQFPLRDSFRQLKALFHYKVLGQKDNNGIYLADTHIVKQEYPLDRAGILRAASRFNYLREKYLKESAGNIVMAVVPDKGVYLGDASGHLQLNVNAMMQLLEEQMPWANHVNLTEILSASDYYRTDTHWKQENLFDVADALCVALEAEKTNPDAYTATKLERPFYGVYYGQAALKLEADAMCILESDILSGCTTSVGTVDMRTGEVVFEKLYDGVYDWGKFDGKDMYEGYLSGTQGILRVDNPNAATERELVMIRDSFGSSIAPLLMQQYRSVTLVDIRAVQIDLLGRFIDFQDQDVLFLFSSLVLNNSSTLK